MVTNLGLDATGVADAPIQEMGLVVPDAKRCVQCGVCGYNCPVGIPVRDYARQGLPVTDPACITCGNCIQVCPRGTLRWETAVYQD
ncbi:MAG: 4Fe-4S binding protein [Anaerolineales bacterium]|nr:4Fe-4S binding protein [Anaerolineales bacterium]